jgi:tetratricopeptide (TPR) repeat protein
MMRWTRATAVSSLFLCGVLPAQAPAAATDARQIHWQRSLADALQVAQATGRPLLLAVNMDGESASDRIVHEQYCDPAFVALTRRCVCLGASVFRHNARDHDDQGRRIPCPRFGCITCGEHMALEPELFAKYLADGERVAPRHALVRADGSKAFDLSLCFDLRDVDRALAAAVSDAPGTELPAIVSDWAALAARRDAGGRAALENALAELVDETSLLSALAAIGANGDAGTVEALRLVAAQLPARSPRVVASFTATVSALQLVAPTADALRSCVRDLGAIPGDPGPSEAQRGWNRALAALPGADATTTSFLLAQSAVGADAHGDALQAHGGPVDLATLLQTAAAVTHGHRDLPQVGGPSDDMPAEHALVQTLNRLDAEQSQRHGEAAWHAEFAKASLDLGRRHLETGARDTQLLLEDAANHWGKALDAEPDHYVWWVERARTAYFLQHFDDEAAFGARAFALAANVAQPPAAAQLTPRLLEDPRAIEALRWVGDGHARMLATRAGKDAAVELGGMVDGLRALGIVATSPFGSDRDWISFGSFAGAIGLWRQEQAIVQCGALRFPASRDLRQALNAALWNCGRQDLSGAVAEQIVRNSAPSADADWFAGYAQLLVAEDARRIERPWSAVAAYERALRWFASAAVRNPDYRDSCDYFAAVAQVGRGHAFARAGERARGAEALVAAVQRHADLSQLRDGLGYDVLDLVDKLTERRGGASQPVAPVALLDQLDAVAKDDPFWAVAVADSALREALRADGRNPDRVERKTVDAAGNEITMLMGRPTGEGDEWLRASIEAGRRAVARARTDADNLPLAQSDTIQAERLLERGRLDGVREALAEAATTMGWAVPAAEADETTLRACVEQFRSHLGPARPRLREGR